jgi:hypothetical protein
MCVPIPIYYPKKHPINLFFGGHFHSYFGTLWRALTIGGIGLF